MQIFDYAKILSNGISEIRRNLQKSQVTNNNQKSLAQIDNIMVKAEALLEKLKSTPIDNAESDVRHYTSTLRHTVFSSAILSFVTTIDSNHREYGKITKEEYIQIVPLLNKWRLGHSKGLIDEDTFREFRNDLVNFTHNYPNWFTDGSLADFFDECFWNPAFRRFDGIASLLCKQFIDLLQSQTWRMRELLDSNYASLSPFEFEHLVGKLFTEMGYDTAVTSASGDYGVDVLARNTTETIAIQVKKYSHGNNVGNRAVQMLLGAMQHRSIRATKAILVTTSDFTAQAREQAKECPVELWNGEYLDALIRKYLCVELR